MKVSTKASDFAQADQSSVFTFKGSLRGLMNKYILILLLSFFGLQLQAQLAQGDIAIVGFNSDISPDEMTIVVLAPIPAGQTIYISDYPWDGAAFDATQVSDGVITWTTTTSVGAGTVIKITILSDGTLTIGGGLSAFGAVSASGWEPTLTMLRVAVEIIGLFTKVRAPRLCQPLGFLDGQTGLLITLVLLLMRQMVGKVLVQI